jgi:hypothetical protein
MPSSAQTTESAAWPEGVIARYLTVAGATVDLTYNDVTANILAVCGGELCHWSDHTNTEGRYDDTPVKEQERFNEWLPIAKRHAQEHAEKCRALPRPTA